MALHSQIIHRLPPIYIEAQPFAIVVLRCTVWPPTAVDTSDRHRLITKSKKSAYSTAMRTFEEPWKIHQKPLLSCFERALRRSKAQGHGPAAQMVFPWIAGAKRLLNIAEPREAVAVEIGQTYTETSRLYNDTEHVASWCESLVEVNLEDDLIQFAHSTVRSFLLGEPADPGLKDFPLDLEASDHLLETHGTEGMCHFKSSELPRD
ncbi:Ankyrin repeat and protein kinase domain-containing protein [Apiospora aurea]|uniref:Ankyrin repeat and protein kinase domain-containing protein n=1 Tax=Apiospora aurea TaxID=335848 RepID=A0ABR1Q2J9_9PEZI